eukprot:GFUD01004739.1.p1 GENE.GFUD01004739.1~~GFUD01004739.1.p1  ORF type:complete len:661 (+),score=257.13 GFUD01004739.1:92-2074(+)
MSMYGETKDAKRLQVDATSLADLKAEVYRKKGEAVKNRQKGNYRPEKAQVKGGKKNNIWSKENTGLLARIQKDMETKKEEERTQERVRLMLEKKTRLYNSLKKGKGNSEVAQNFLVNFGGRDDSDSDGCGDAKDYIAVNKGDEWVEYVDALGRTRSCMKKDLPSLKRQDKEMVREDEEEQETGQGLRKEEPDMMNADLRMDTLRQKWEQEEMENLEKESLHYSDVRFDEARTHGAGHYNFSREEEKRSQEQSTLKKLHEETDEMRKQKEKKAEKRKREMAERIKKIKAKKRQKQGLPPLESDDESDNENKDAKDSDSDDDPNEDISKSVMEGLKMFRRDNEEMERERNSAMRAASSTTRDWDREKEVQEDDLGRSKEWKVMSQDQWVDKKRVERKNEFAPPSAYSEARFLLKNKEQKIAQAQTEKRKPAASYQTKPPVQKTVPSNAPPQYYPNNWGYPPSGQYPPPGQYPPTGQYAPPGQYPPTGQYPPQNYPPPNYYPAPPPPPGTQPPNPPPGTQPLNPPPKIDPMAMLDANPEPTPSFIQDTTPDPSLFNATPKPTPPSYSKCVRMELHQRMKNQDFLPAASSNGGGLNSKILEAFNDSDSEEEEDPKRGTGAEVAPPCDMDYYNYTGGPASNSRAGFRSHHDMADAFNAGLNSMKK